MDMFDGIIIGVVILSGIFASYRGLVRELLGLASWILAALGALYSLEYLRPSMYKVITNPTIADIVSVSVVALVILVICTLFNAYITSKLRKSSLSGLDRMLGFGFGLLRGALLIIVIYMACLFLNTKSVEDFKQANNTLPYIKSSAEMLEKMLPPSLIETLKGTAAATKSDEPAKKQKVRERGTATPITPTAAEAAKTAPDSSATAPAAAPAYDDKERHDLDELILEIEEEKKS